MIEYPPPPPPHTHIIIVQDIILVAIGALGYLAGAAAIATYANRWRELSNTGTDSNQFESTFRRVISATVAAAVSTDLTIV